MNRPEFAESLAALLDSPQDEAARDFVYHYAPIILFDEREPFLPLAGGYTVFTEDGPSASFRRDVALRGADAAIEYAIWWDWDIEHLYELEHVWVYVKDDEVMRVEASWHGKMHDMLSGPHEPVRGTHPVVYSQPGKHAFAAMPDWYDEFKAWAPRQSQTNRLAGAGGVLAPAMFGGKISECPLYNTLVRTYMQRMCFDASWSFTNEFSFNREQMVPWKTLFEWIPSRVNLWTSIMEQEIAPSEYRYLRIGHRGARAYAPDNTLTSFKKAIELDADFSELDVHLTADGKIAVIHDDMLRTNDGQFLKVHEHTLEELQRVDLGGGERVPELKEVFALARQSFMGLLIEIKDGRVIPQLAGLFTESWMKRLVMVSSFRPDWVAEFGAAVPGVSTAVLFESANINAVALAKAAGAQYVDPCWEGLRDDPADLLTEEWMKAVREANLGIICWSEQRPKVIEHLRQIGVDALCSDQPDLL